MPKPIYLLCSKIHPEIRTCQPLFRKLFTVQHYFEQSFDTAYTAFERVLKQNPEDAAAQLFLTKVKWLRETEIEEGWTGIELMNQAA